MQFLLTSTAALVAIVATLTARPLERSDLVLVRAVLDGDTIDVASVGRVRLLGIDAPEIGRVFDTPAPFAYAAREKLSSLVLHRFVRLESDGERLDVYHRRLAYVVTGDEVCANVVLVREGLARVTARVRLARLDELKHAEAEAQAFRKGIWGAAPPDQSPGYTHRSPKPSTKKRRSSWPRSPSSTHRSARSANSTSSTTGSITGRSGSSSSSSRRAR